MDGTVTKLLCNVIITRDGTRLESTHRHDYKNEVKHLECGDSLKGALPCQ
jgi:hypothetical protein